MYVNPIFYGILITLFTIETILIVWALCLYKNDKNKEDK